MKRNTMVGVVLVILALAVAGGGYWWSHRVSFVYQGLAGQFPDRVQAFFEMKELGQWMPPGNDKAPAAATTTSRGTDPMLQVLQTVWAAPPVTAKDLPEILRTKPVAAGFWLEGDVLKGGALMPLAPGERAAVEKALKDKLGDTPVVETVAGVGLHKLEVPNESAKFKMDTALWGVSDQAVVMALGVDGAKAVLTPPATPLSTNAAFLAVQRTFPEQAGASLYITGDLMAQGVKLGSEAAASMDSQKPADKEPAKPADEAKPAPKTGKADKATPVVPEEKPAPSGDKDREILKAALKVGLQKFMAMDSVNAFAMWTSPPKGDEKGWKVQTWLAFKDQPKGVWRLASQGAGRTPQMAGRLPKRAQVYVWGAGRDPARFYQDVMEELAKDLPADQMSWVRAGIGAAEGKVGMSFANDLLPTLSDEWCVVRERAAAASGEGAKGAGHSKGAVFIMLRDSRRFEDLVSQKLAAQLKLTPLELKGARGWKWGEGEQGLNLIVSGGMAILTSDPAWALDTGGAPERAWKALSDYRRKACMLIMVDPAKQAAAQDVMVQVECECGPTGLLMKGRFPGEAPGMFCKDKGDKPEAGKEPPKGSI